MAQAEDMELRDLVIEALERNGSLAKVRALLRANVFLAFENECENMKQNVRLDNILKLPEGIVALSIVHEFLEFCNLKNTLFVYMAESRQKKEYFYQGTKILSEKLKLQCQGDKVDEPVLVSLIKKSLRISCSDSPNEKGVNKEEQNCTYIVHEDSGSTLSSSQSDTSSDEKNKLHLRLHLDNSDTDSSTDSVKDKQCSEYIPRDHINQVTANTEQKINKETLESALKQIESPKNFATKENDDKKVNFSCDLKMGNNSSESTSYVELKPKYEDVRSTSRLQKETSINQMTQEIESQPKDLLNITSNIDLPSPASISNISTLSKNDTFSENASDNKLQQVPTEQNSNTEYSLDFTSLSLNKNKEITEKNQSPKSVSEDASQKSPNKSSLDNSQHNSPRSFSSVSVSDVADLISERSLSSDHQHRSDHANKSKSSPCHSLNRIINLDPNKISDDSGDFSESPIPSLSNLSLDIHSD